MKLIQLALAAMLLAASPLVFAGKPDPVDNPPLQIREQNLDPNNDAIRVSQQGTVDVEIVDSLELDVNVTNSTLDVSGSTVSVDSLPEPVDTYVTGGELSPVNRAYYDGIALDPDETISHTFSGGPILATLIYVSDSDAEGWYKFHSAALAPGGEHDILLIDDLGGQSPDHTISLQYPMELDGFTIHCANESDLCTPHITVVGFAP